MGDRALKMAMQFGVHQGRNLITALFSQEVLGAKRYCLQAGGGGERVTLRIPDIEGIFGFGTLP